ncbi:MAG: ABC transporter permease [bacterium]
MDKKGFGKTAFRTGGIIVLLLLVAAAFSPWLSPYDPAAQNLAERLSGPSLSHPLGQDQHGRDILSLVIYGARVSVIVGVGTVLLSAVVGFIAGAVSGLKGGVWDQVIMRVVDVLLAFPGILLAIALVAVTGPGIGNVIIALSARGWVTYARIVRGQVLVERERGYVEAARSLGAGSGRIISLHLLPNTLTPVVVQATFGLAGAILAEASLSFLGLGPQEMPTWGAMLADGTSFLRNAPHIALFPGIAIMATVLAFNFMGDSLRDRLTKKGAE